MYIRSYPDATAKIQASVGGGSAPVWSRDGTRLYYGSTRGVIAARLALGSSVQIISRDTVFRFPQGFSFVEAFNSPNFDVQGDGSRGCSFPPRSPAASR